MKIDGTQVLVDYKGKPILFPSSGETKPGEKAKEVKVTFREVVSTSINATPQPPAKPLTAEDKNKAYQISVKLWGKKVADLTVDQLAFIKEKVGEVYGPLVYGRVCDILEGGKNEEEPKKEK